MLEPGLFTVCEQPARRRRGGAGGGGRRHVASAT
jgi:hypothetical protein